MSTTAQPDVIEHIAVTYPSGNTTAVIFDELPGADRKLLNNRILNSWKAQHPDKPGLEQCCLVTKATDPRAIARVDMLDNEFSGNAVRSVAWLITAGQNFKGLIEASGADGPIEFQVRGGFVTIEVPLPEKRPLARRTDEGTLVQMDGITHLVVTDANLQVKQTPRQLLDKLLRENKYNVSDQGCVSVTYFDEASRKSEFCVWRKNGNTFFNESASGSGTGAIGIAQSMRAGKSLKLKIMQPSGQIITSETKFSQDLRRVVRSAISGKVSILYKGELLLDKT
jgi:diaminopimelate epimerase